MHLLGWLVGWFDFLQIVTGIHGSHHEVVTLAFIISAGSGVGRLESSMREWLCLLLQEGRSGEGAGLIQENRVGEGGLTEPESQAAKG
jgi:hypothetical protein